MTQQSQVPHPRVGLGVFVWRDNKFVIQQRIGSHGANTWALPGGHLEFGESWEECARREVMEEIGADITNVRFLAVTNDIFEEQKHYITIYMEADWAANEPTIQEPDRIAALRWSTFRDLPEPLFEPCWQNLRTAKPELFRVEL